MAEPSLESLTEGAGKTVGPYVIGDVAFDDGKVGGPSDTGAPLQPDPPRESIESLTRPPQALVDIQNQKTKALETERQRQTSFIEQDQAETHRRFAQTGIEPGTLEPWDNNKQREKYRTDPIESFGSLGSVFAMVASAFTRAPMENALNGAAAAMNAIKAGDEKEFELAHRAWKENTDLALKRHDIMQRQYENAIQLMSSDVTAGQAKMRMLAASYDDRQLSALMDAGFWPQGIELMERRNRIAKDNREIIEGDEKSRWQREAFKSELEKNKQIQDPYEKALADQKSAYKIYGWGKQPDTTAQQTYAIEIQKNPGMPVDKRIELATKLGLTGYANRQHQNPQMEFINRHVEELTKPVEEGGAGMTVSQAMEEANRRWTQTRTPAKAQTSPQVQAEEIKRRAAEYMHPKEEGGLGLPPTEAFDRANKEVMSTSKQTNTPREGTEAEYVSRRAKELVESGEAKDKSEGEIKARGEWKQSSIAITGNKRADMQLRVKQYDHSMDKIDSVLGVLKKYIGTAGTAGYARRLEERLSNIAGSNRTDFVQMMRDIEYLQLEAPRLLLNASGRPLSSEAGHISSIVAGLKAGDTTANTIRAMNEIQKLYRQSQKEVKDILGEKTTEDSSLPPKAKPAGGPGQNWWDVVPDKRR